MTNLPHFGSKEEHSSSINDLETQWVACFSEWTVLVLLQEFKQIGDGSGVIMWRFMQV